jgi:hypothetical protein
VNWIQLAEHTIPWQAFFGQGEKPSVLRKAGKIYFTSETVLRYVWWPREVLAGHMLVTFMSMGRDCVSEMTVVPSGWCMSMESSGGIILTGENRRTRRKICPSAISYAINPTWIDPGANPGLHGERSATNCLSHGTAMPCSNSSRGTNYKHLLPTVRCSAWNRLRCLHPHINAF